MSADVHDLTGDKTMKSNAHVRLANDDVWSMRSTGGTSALIADTGASETAYRRPHAPRSGKPKSATLTGLHFDISSTSRLRSATHRSRISSRRCVLRMGIHSRCSDSASRKQSWS
jgi:hypothetical protein